jgi:hypothetical protein
MIGAPAGVSQDLQQFTRFYPSKNGNGLRMHTCAPIVEVLRTFNSTSGAAIFGAVSADGRLSMQLNLTQPATLTDAGTKTLDGFTSPVFDLIASAFVRYKIDRLVFHYEPQASATTEERLVFAYANDPNHPVLWSTTLPTTSSLLSLADSIAFVPWRAWSMDVSRKLQDQLFYTYSDPSTTVGSFPERFSDFGVFSILGSTDLVSSAKCGVLYMEVELELFEFCPISVTRPSAALHLVRKLVDKTELCLEKEKGKSGGVETTPKASSQNPSWGQV